MLKLPHLLRLLCAWALLLVPAIASAHSPVHPETRVGAFEVAAKACVRLSVLANSSGHQEKLAARTAEASGYPHATKGATAMSTKQAAQMLKQAPGSFPNMPAFGKAVGWGRNGGEAAFARAGSITKAEAQSLGITSSEAFAIRDAYRAVINSSKGAANPTALGREALMNRVGQLLQ